MRKDNSFLNLIDNFCQNSDNLLSGHRVHHPGQHKTGHQNEQSPEYFFDLIVLAEHINHRFRVRLHRPLHQLRHEHKQRQEQNRSADESQGNLRPALQGRSRLGPQTHRPALPPSRPHQTRSNAFSACSSFAPHLSA